MDELELWTLGGKVWDLSKRLENTSDFGVGGVGEGDVPEYCNTDLEIFRMRLNFVYPRGCLSICFSSYALGVHTDRPQGIASSATLH